MLLTRNELRNIHIGVGFAVFILVIALIFFNDASEGVIGAIGMFAFFSSFVVHHTLDELERRRSRKRPGSPTREATASSSRPPDRARPDPASAAPRAPHAS
jgi:hypothetical protein